MTVTGKDYNESYQIQIGTGVYTETAYNYSVIHPGVTGVFNISAYVSNSDGTVKTRTISFNVICAVAGEQRKLVAVNNILGRATNWSENSLFDYAMYDGDNVITSAKFTIKKMVRMSLLPKKTVSHVPPDIHSHSRWRLRQWIIRNLK